MALIEALEDVPVLGAFVSIGVVIAEVVLHSGDLVIILLAGLIGNADLLVGMLSALDRFVSMAGIDAIPQSWIQNLLMIAVAALLAGYVWRLGKRFIEKND